MSRSRSRDPLHAGARLESSLGLGMSLCWRSAMRSTVLATSLVLAAMPLGALAMDEHGVVQPDALKWGAGPPFLPSGVQVAIISGDPSKDGPYVIRAKMPAGYKV